MHEPERRSGGSGQLAPMRTPRVRLTTAQPGSGAGAIHCQIINVRNALAPRNLCCPKHLRARLGCMARPRCLDALSAPRPYHPAGACFPVQTSPHPRISPPRHPAVSQGCCGFVVSWNSGTRQNEHGNEVPTPSWGCGAACSSCVRSVVEIALWKATGGSDPIRLQGKLMRQHCRRGTIASEVTAQAGLSRRLSTLMMGRLPG